MKIWAVSIYAMQGTNFVHSIGSGIYAETQKEAKDNSVKEFKDTYPEYTVVSVVANEIQVRWVDRPGYTEG